MLFPVNHQRTREKGETARLRKSDREWSQFLKSLKHKWSNFWRRALLTIAQEEMRIRREELTGKVPSLNAKGGRRKQSKNKTSRTSTTRPVSN
jgi:hypothetical protein